MDSMEYWKIRNMQGLAAVEAEEEKTKKRLAKMYKAESVRLRQSIAAFYKQNGEKGVIEFRKLLQQLPEDEKSLLYRDYSAFCATHPEAAWLEPIRNNIYKLNRLEGLQASVNLHLAETGEEEIEEVTEHLKKVGYTSWEATADALHHGVNSNIATRFVDVPWTNGENFSTRIWGNTAKTANMLNTQLAQGFARGDNYRKLTKQLTETFENVSSKNAYRLVYTEGTYVYNETGAAVFEEEGYTRYQIATAQDSRVCPICADLEGIWFNFEARMPGTNFPPLHPFCRCSFTVDTGRGEEA